MLLFIFLSQVSMLDAYFGTSKWTSAWGFDTPNVKGAYQELTYNMF